MKIKIYNATRLTRTPFFQALIEYLAEQSDVILRQIHKDFSDVKNIDRQIDSFIAAGFVNRTEKRYTLAVPVFSDENFDLNALTGSSVAPQRNNYAKPFFVAADSKLAAALDASIRHEKLTNSINAIELNFSSRYDLATDTLFNYFHKVKENLPLTALETEVYGIIGDVDPDYALKYMTTFLLKFMKKEIVKTKADIFVQVLEKYGYVERLNEREFTSNLNFDELEIPTVEHETPENFISAQLQQTKSIKNYISLSDEFTK